MLGERMKAIAGEYGFPFRTSDDGATHLMECLFGGGRSQVVSGTTLETPERRTHAVFTIVGPLTGDLDLADLLRRHMTWKSARIGLLEDDLVVAATLDPDRVRGEDGEEVVKEALREVSTLGDELEDELFGTDEN